MKFRLLPRLALTLALGLAGLYPALSPALAKDDHKHDSHSAHAAKLSLNKGEKWETDQPLRSGMEAIRKDMEAALPAIKAKSLSDQDYSKLADSVLAQVQRIVGECKLPPESDAQLHIVIEKLVEGTDVMSKGRKKADGAHKIMKALRDYGEHFAHPGWTKPAA